MKVKKKRLMLVCAVFLFMFASVFALAISGGGMTAYAASMPKYTLAYDYSHYYNYNTGKTLDGSGTDTLSTTVKGNSGNTTTVRFYLYGSSQSGTADLQKGGAVSQSNLTITLDATFQGYSMKVTNSAGTQVGSQSGKNYTLSSLSDGTYYFSCSLRGTGWNPNSRAFAWYSMEITSSFVVDTNAPTISGASTSTVGKYVTTAFTVSATDGMSGIANLYWKDPSSSTYSSVAGSSKTVTAGSTNGLYSFYAVDKAGNRSSTYYVYYDSVAPAGKVTTSKGETIANGGTTNETFTYTVTESGSGLSTLYYKTPSSGSWKTCNSGKTIESTAEEGEYSFKATDKAGNSEIYTVTLADPCSAGHDYVSSVVSPTCTSGGYTKYTCSRCGSTYNGNATSSIGHSYKATTTAATCANGGYTTYTCTRCGYGYTGNTTAALGHSYEAVTTSSSCTVGGYTTYKCSRCGVSHTDSPTQATGHSYVASIVEPTCTQRGYTTFTCTKCGDSYRDNETASLGHNYVGEAVSATCNGGGYTKYTCTRCGHNYTGGVKQPTGHNYVTTTVAATCSEGGYSLHTCSICGDSYQDNLTQPNGHNFISSTREATCILSGGTIYTCQICGYEYSDNSGTYPKGHNYTTTIITSPTCTTDGLRRSVCDACGDTYDTAIAANGHNYIISDVLSENGITTRKYTCTECGENYTQELGDQYEEVSNYVEYLFEQYSPYMWWVLLAAAGVWSIVMGVFFAIAQKNEDKEKAKKMVINYIIGLVVIAIIVVACPYLIRGIAALVT